MTNYCKKITILHEICVVHKGFSCSLITFISQNGYKVWFGLVLWHINHFRFIMPNPVYSCIFDMYGL